jgi:hypothetical protein
MPSLSPQCFMFLQWISVSHFEVEKIDLPCHLFGPRTWDLRPTILHSLFSFLLLFLRINCPKSSTKKIVPRNNSKFEHESELFRKNRGIKNNSTSVGLPGSTPRSGQKNNCLTPAKNLEPGTCEHGTMFPPFVPESNRKLSTKITRKKKLKTNTNGTGRISYILRARNKEYNLVIILFQASSFSWVPYL